MASSGSYDGMFIGDGEQNVVNWKLGPKIASGRHGTVSHVKNLKDQQLRKYVVKQSIISDDINRESLESIDTEIRALRHVDHYRIIKYFGFSRTESVFSLFIEFMEKGSLAKYINSQLHGRLSEEKAAMFTYQILEGLVFLHGKRIIHRDIKGSNILMQDENNIKISDFGVAKILNTLSQANTQGKGTISWMAPEMFKDGTHKNTVDIWSLGCTLYQMVTGKIPFEGLSIFQISQRVSKNEHELPMPETCSDILKDFLSQVCRKEPSERPSAEDLLKHDLVKGFTDIKRENSQTFDDKDDVDSLEMAVCDLADSATVSVEELWIKKNYSKVLKEIRVEDFTPDLIEKGFIDWDDEEEIDNKDSRCTKVKCLIRKLRQSKKAEALKTFLALLESKYPTFKDFFMCPKNRGIHSKLTEKDASRYASAVGRNWQDFCLNLNFTQVEIDQEYESCNYDVKQTITNLLIKWVGRMKDQATHKSLHDALKKTEELHRVRVDWDHVNKIYKESIEEGNNSQHICNVLNDSDSSDTEPELFSDALDETDIFFKRFLDVLKHYWLKLVKTTKQGLVLEYFHKDRFNVTTWFESIKQSPVTSYMQKIGKDWSNFDLVLHKTSSHEKFKDALVFISLVFSYNNNLIEILKKNKKEGKFSQETDNFCEAVEAVSSVIVIFQALMPWSTSSCLKELRDQIDILQNKIDRISFTFEYRPYTNLDFIENLVVYDIDVLCNVMGLETQFSLFAKNVGVDMWLHDLQSSHVLNWLKRNNECMVQSETSTEDMSIANALKQKLVLLGFTKRKAASIAEDVPEDWINHQSALDLATSHILDMFQCHPLLTETSGFPYNNTVTDVLFDQTVQLDDGHTVSERSIKVMNVCDISNTEVQSSFQRYIKNKVPDGNIRLFHGTSHADAKSILTLGIRLRRGHPRQDFSHNDGFYLSYVFNHAKEWAKIKSRRPAIIVYSIGETTLQQFNGLVLYDDIINWRTTIKYCRNGYEGRMPSNFSDTPYINGPMCRNPEGVCNRNQDPVTHDGVRNQLCVKNTDLVRVFNLHNSIVCVIFYKESMH